MRDIRSVTVFLFDFFFSFHYNKSVAEKSGKGGSMRKITIEVDGMMCGNCEKHVNEAVKKIKGVKDVISSHTDKLTTVIADDKADVESIKEAIAEQGYTVGTVQTEPYAKKGFFSFLKK